MATRFKVGDHVKVTLEGEVASRLTLDSGAVLVRVTQGYRLFVDPSLVERAEPPFEVFGPGDVVRDPDGGVRVLADNGWINDCLFSSWKRNKQRFIRNSN